MQKQRSPVIAQLVLVIFAGSRMKGDRIALGRPD